MDAFPAPRLGGGNRGATRRLGIVLALALLAGVMGVAYQRLAQLHVDSAWNEHTHVVIETIEQTRVALLAADGLRRGYRLSFDPAQHDLMGARIAEAERFLDEVGELTADNPSQQARVATLRPMIEQRASILREGLDLPRWELMTQATRDEQRAVQGRGIAVAKDVRVVFEAMLAEELHLLHLREAHALATAQSVQTAVVLGGVIGLCLVGAFYVSLERENRRRRVAQEALERSTILVSAVVEGTSDLIGVKDHEGRYLLANGALASYFRRATAEILGRTDADLMSPEDAGVVMTNDREIMASGGARVFEQHLVNGGEPRTFLSTKAPYRDPAGGTLGVISVSRDITERKLLELEVAELAVRDPLTGLFNRRYMDGALGREIDRATRTGGSVSVVMIDLDHFKRLNDTHGHAAGDAVLKRFAEVLRGGVRREDVVCRYGGEEFVVILPELGHDKARERAEAWRAKVEAMCVELGDETIRSMSASLGVASFPAHGASATDVLKAADLALYRAKTGGRNRVLVCEGA